MRLGEEWTKDVEEVLKENDKQARNSGIILLIGYALFIYLIVSPKEYLWAGVTITLSIILAFLARREYKVPWSDLFAFHAFNIFSYTTKYDGRNELPKEKAIEHIDELDELITEYVKSKKQGVKKEFGVETIIETLKKIQELGNKTKTMLNDYANLSNWKDQICPLYQLAANKLHEEEFFPKELIEKSSVIEGIDIRVKEKINLKKFLKEELFNKGFLRVIVISFAVAIGVWNAPVLATNEKLLIIIPAVVGILALYFIPQRDKVKKNK